jgi:lysyl-tRNA synthetase class II
MEFCISTFGFRSSLPYYWFVADYNNLMELTEEMLRGMLKHLTGSYTYGGEVPRERRPQAAHRDRLRSSIRTDQHDLRT